MFIFIEIFTLSMVKPYHVELAESAKRASALYRKNVHGLQVPGYQNVFWFQKVKTVPSSEKRPPSLIVKAFRREPDVPLKKTTPTENITWIFYPAEKHLSTFAEAASFVSYGGPAMAFPGSVGSIYGSIHPEKSVSVLKIMQAHFRSEHKIVNRALVSQYGGWRTHLLREFFSESKEAGCTSVMYATDKEDDPRIRDFKKVAEEHGYKFFVKKLVEKPNNMGRERVLVAQMEPEPTLGQKLLGKLRKRSSVGSKEKNT